MKQYNLEQETKANKNKLKQGKQKMNLRIKEKDIECRDEVIDWMIYKALRKTISGFFGSIFITQTLFKILQYSSHFKISIKPYQINITVNYAQDDKGLQFLI